MINKINRKGEKIPLSQSEIAEREQLENELIEKTRVDNINKEIKELQNCITYECIAKCLLTGDKTDIESVYNKIQEKRGLL